MESLFIQMMFLTKKNHSLNHSLHQLQCNACEGIKIKKTYLITKYIF